MSILPPKNAPSAPPPFCQFWTRILTKVEILVPKNGTSGTHFFFSEKNGPEGHFFGSFGPFWRGNFEPIFGSVLGGQNEGPGGRGGGVQNLANLTLLGAKSTTV